MAEPAVDRPVITLPPDEEAAVRRYYAQAQVILEYGSGGSTVIAAELPGKTLVLINQPSTAAPELNRRILAFANAGLGTDTKDGTMHV